jgi:hypothetical protein
MAEIEADIAKRMKRAPKPIRKPSETDVDLDNDEWIKLGEPMEK